MASSAEHGFWVASSNLTTLHKSLFKENSRTSPMSNLKKLSLGPHKMEPRVGDTSIRIITGLDLNIPLFQAERVVL